MLITQSRLRTQWVIGCAGYGRGECCVWHVNSNQGSDIHQAPWPTVRINLGRKGGARKPFFFVSASICRRFSHIHTPLLALYHCLPVFSCSSIYLLPFHHNLYLAVCCLLSPPMYPLFLFSRAVMSQHSYFVCGR